MWQPKQNPIVIPDADSLGSPPEKCTARIKCKGRIDPYGNGAFDSHIHKKQLIRRHAPRSHVYRCTTLVTVHFQQKWVQGILCRMVTVISEYE